MPSRWFAAGRENLLGSFRKRMLSSRKIRRLKTFSEGSELFTNVEIKGGICYYLEDIKFNGACEYTLQQDGITQSVETDLGQFDILIRDPRLISIIEKVTAYIVKNELQTVDQIVSSDTPFGIPSNPKTSPKNPFDVYSYKSVEHDVLLYHIENQKRKIEYVCLKDIKKNKQDVDKYKVFIPGAGGSGNDDIVLGMPEYAPLHSVCSQSYLYVPFNTSEEATNFLGYIKTRVFRILVSAIKITQSAPNRVYRFVPFLPLNKNWLDEDLYSIFDFNVDEIAYIKSKIKPMN